MPKYITHWIIAEKVFQGLDERSAFKPVIARGKASYLIGSVVLDTPFYLIWGRDAGVMNRMAEHLHNTRNSSFRFAAEFLAACEQNRSRFAPVLAMLLGIITHIYADAVFHPMVYFFSGPPLGKPKTRNQSAARHHTLETYLDLYFEKAFQSSYQWKFSALLKRIEIEPPQFFEILTHLFSVRGDHGIRMIKKAVRMNAAIQGLFDKKLPRLLMDGLNLVPGIDVSHFVAHFYPYQRPDPRDLFQNALNFRHPVTGERLLFSVEGFIDLAVQRALSAFDDLSVAYRKNKPLSDILRSMDGPNLYTGLHNRGKSDMIFFDASREIQALAYRNF